MRDAEWVALVGVWQRNGIDRAIVSLEAGPEFLLDNSRQSRRLAQLFQYALRSGVHIEGLILQDPSWAADPEAARRRLHAVSEFSKSQGGLMDAVQIDVEVYTPPVLFPSDEGWARYAILVTALREQLRMDRSNLRLNAALPWWMPAAVPVSDLSVIYQSLDGVLLMVYGEPGGTPVAADLATFQEKVQPLVAKWPEDGPSFRIGIAAYEHSSGSALGQFAAELDSILEKLPPYAGVGYFPEMPGR